MAPVNPVAADAKLELFAREYIVDFNATAAALRAGLAKARPSAKQRGYEMMQREDVQAKIAELVLAHTERLDVTVEDIVAGLLDEARYRGDGTSHAARVAAWAHLGKYKRVFGDGGEKASTDAYDRVAAARERADARASGKLTDIADRRRRA